jgi:hypothetical protein
MWKRHSSFSAVVEGKQPTYYMPEKNKAEFPYASKIDTEGGQKYGQ